MRILHTSDWHVGRRIRTRDRSGEHRAVLDELTRIADEEAVDLTLVAGDLFDVSSPPSMAEEIVWRALLNLADVSPVAVVAGNHDNPRRLDAVAPLLAMAGVAVVGAPRSPEEGGVVELAGAKVALLPFVSRRGIVRAEQIMADDPDRHAGTYEDRIRAIVDRLTEAMTADTVNLLVSHLTVHGAVAAGGERRAHIFGYAVPAAAFPGRLSHVALGHFHSCQQIPHAAPVWYSGSPLQLDFSETDDRKCALLVEASPGLPSKVVPIPLTSGRRLARLRGSLDEVRAAAAEVGDAYVKVELVEKARVGLADEVRKAVPDVDFVDVVLVAQPAEKRSEPDEPRPAMQPVEAFGRYLADNGAADPNVEALFAELLDEAGSE